MSSQRDLFGGAIKATLPPNFIDASDLRQVPDTQEVFLDPNSTISVIIEILEKVEPPDATRAAEFHFGSLAHDNSALSSIVHDITIIPNDLQGDSTPSRIVLVGTQSVPKFNQLQPDEVRIAMCLFRIEEKNIDIVVTANVPVESTSGDAVGEEGWVTAKAVFDTLIRSFKIVDFGLFT